MNIDINKLLEELGETSTYSLLNKFLITYKDYKNHLRIDNEDLDKYIHKLKGSSGNLKINSVHELCIDFPKNENKSEVLDNLIKKIEDSFLEIKTILKDEKTNNEKLDPNKIGNALDELIFDLNEFNYIEDSRVKVILNSLDGIISNKIIDNLEKEFANGNYEKSTILCQTIRSLI